MLRILCRTHSIPLIINDDVELALTVGADGVHLGKNDLALEAARAALGEEKILGASCYDSLSRAQAAQQAGASYVAFGSFFASAVKPDAVRAPVDILRAAKVKLSIPVVAIGGITLENAGALIEAGAHSLAVISALFDAADIRSSAERFAGLFEVSHASLTVETAG